MIFGDLGGLKLPDICLIGEEKPQKYLTHETCPDRESNPGPLYGRHACYRLAHSGGQMLCLYSQQSLSRIIVMLIHFEHKVNKRYGTDSSHILSHVQRDPESRIPPMLKQCPFSHVKIVPFFPGTICSRWLKFLQVFMTASTVIKHRDFFILHHHHLIVFYFRKVNSFDSWFQ